MLSVIYTERRYAECRCAECRYAEYCYAEYLYAKCRCAKGNYTACHGTLVQLTNIRGLGLL
jgi:hypothetical protein